MKARRKWLGLLVLAVGLAAAPALRAESLGERLRQAAAAAGSFKTGRLKRQASGQAKIDAELRQAMALRQSIRRLLLDNGIRLDKDVASEAHASGQVSGSGSFNSVSARPT